jgi:hypothetical protein
LELPDLTALAVDLNAPALDLVPNVVDPAWVASCEICVARIRTKREKNCKPLRLAGRMT